MKICIDSSSYIAMHRGKGKIGEILAKSEEVIIPAATFAELTEGFLGDAKGVEKNSEFNNFLDMPNVRFVPAGHSIAYRYAQISHSLKRRGTPVPPNDIWIAATAFENGACVLSYDAHFDRIDGRGRIAP
jgi:tRNA(fMet)-specific endonuclease VapC